MNSIVLQVLLYAFVAGASPVALGSTLVVLGSRGGRWNGLSFAIGVVVGQVLVLVLAYALGTATLPVGQHAHETARELMELALGIALLFGGGVRMAAASGQAAEAELAVEGGPRAPGPSQPGIGIPRRRGAGARTEAPRTDGARRRDDLRRRSRRGRGDGAVSRLRRHRHRPRDDAGRARNRVRDSRRGMDDRCRALARGSTNAR